MTLDVWYATNKCANYDNFRCSMLTVKKKKQTNKKNLTGKQTAGTEQMDIIIIWWKQNLKHIHRFSWVNKACFFSAGSEIEVYLSNVHTDILIVQDKGDTRDRFMALGAAAHISRTITHPLVMFSKGLYLRGDINEQRMHSSRAPSLSSLHSQFPIHHSSVLRRRLFPFPATSSG